jgi:spoIIIJ-associated protein
MPGARAGVEIKARTVEEAIAQGLLELAASRDEVEIEVLNPGRSGLLGLGAQDASVRLTRLEPADMLPDQPGPTPVEEPAEAPAESVPPGTSETADIATDLLQGLIDRMGVQGRVVARASKDLVEEDDAPALVLDVMGKDLGVLIGRQAETLQSIQYLMRLMLSNRLGHWEPVVVDVESYRARRRRSLRRLALRMAERAVSSQRRVILEAMPAHERRIIHLALHDHPNVVTKSVGEGDHRKVTIVPR